MSKKKKKRIVPGSISLKRINNIKELLEHMPKDDDDVELYKLDLANSLNRIFVKYLKEDAKEETRFYLNHLPAFDDTDAGKEIEDYIDKNECEYIDLEGMTHELETGGIILYNIIPRTFEEAV